MVDHTDDTKRLHRIEVISGVGRRRRWSNEEKARIVAESFAPGAMVTEVARRHDTRAQQVHGWRKDAREGRLILPADVSAKPIGFAPIVVAEPTPQGLRPSRPAAPPIEVEGQGVAVRIGAGAGLDLIEAILMLLRSRS